MKKIPILHSLIAFLIGIAALVFSGWASADPPSRVARLAHISGPVSFLPAGGSAWVQATLNRPLITGDRLWVDRGARAELQIGSSAVRIGGGTRVTLLNLDDRMTQLQVTQGTVHVHVRRLAANEIVKIDTPNLAYLPRRPGAYRVDVDPAGSWTAVATRSGLAEVYGEGNAYTIGAGQSYSFAGTDLRDSQLVQVPADEFEGWVTERTRRVERSQSARYVSPDVIGYEDLDDHGRWRNVAEYGPVWIPSRVPVGWRPYHHGHWAWVEPWGWTWIDDAPWGFAPSHYGRWAHFGGTWGWVPGPVRAQAVYAPALVAFVGGSNFRLAVSSGPGVAWFPLAPREVYRPPYRVSRNHINNVNTSNTTINNTQITNVYNATNVTRTVYVNQQVPGAVTAVPASAFAQAQSVAKTAVPVSRESLANAQITNAADVAPLRTSLQGGAAPGAKPPAEAAARPVVARTAPPAAPAAFDAQQSANAERGRSADKERERGKSADEGGPAKAGVSPEAKPTAADAPPPAVKVVGPATPAAAPPQRQAAAASPTAPTPEKGSPPAGTAKGPEAQKGFPALEAPKLPPPAVIPRVPEAKVPPREAEKEMRPQVSVPRPIDAPAVAPREVEKTTPPPVSVPRPPEALKAVPAPRPPEQAPLRELEKAAPSPVSVPRPPEAARPQPPVSAPTAPEPRVVPREAQRAPQPQAVPRLPEAPRAVPPPRPPDPRPVPPEVQRPQPPEAARPRPPVADKPPPAKQEAPAERRGGKGDDDRIHKQ